MCASCPEQVPELVGPLGEGLAEVVQEQGLLCVDLGELDAFVGLDLAPLGRLLGADLLVSL